MLLLLITSVLQLELPSLQARHVVDTGPVLDSPHCGASGCSADQQPGTAATQTDNYAKILVVDTKEEKLIHCGSVRQGSCHKVQREVYAKISTLYFSPFQYPLSDISRSGEALEVAVAANSPTASTFAFVGPQQYNPWNSRDVLYVGTTFTPHGDYRHGQ